MSDDNKMPDAVKLAIKELLSAASFYRLEAQRDDRPIAAADALESWWRNLAQPVALGMTEELAAPYGDLCWLITCPIGPGHPLPVYYCGFSGLGTTGDYPLAEEDPNKAIRFCRLEDAQKIIVCSVSLTVGGWFASEHLFVSDRKGLQ